MLAKLKYKNQFYLRHWAITFYSSKKIVELFPNFLNQNQFWISDAAQESGLKLLKIVFVLN